MNNWVKLGIALFFLGLGVFGLVGLTVSLQHTLAHILANTSTTATCN